MKWGIPTVFQDAVACDYNDVWVCLSGCFFRRFALCFTGFLAILADGRCVVILVFGVVIALAVFIVFIPFFFVTVGAVEFEVVIGICSTWPTLIALPFKLFAALIFSGVV